MNCPHERSAIIDSQFHGHNYASRTTREIFCDHCRLRRWLDIEVTLAAAQAELGMIPAEAAREIARAASTVDLKNIGEGVRRTGHSMMALLWALQRACEGSAHEYVHHGATTQDIQDTGQVLEMKLVLEVLEQRLDQLLAMLKPLAESHQDRVMVGRTHSVPALPITFGLKVASWIDELLRHRERLREVKGRVSVVQLFGGVGTMAAFGEQGLVLLERFAARLGLGVPLLAWHSSRDRIAEYVTSLAMLCASLARIADELRILYRAEVGEVELRWGAQQIGSSTMPHKRNPTGCEQVVVLARLAKAQVMNALDGMVVEHERDYRGIRLEWCAVTDVSHYAVAAFELLLHNLEGLRVRPERMLENALQAREAICTESLVFRLAPTLGKDTAFRVVHRLSQQTQTQQTSLRGELENDAKLLEALEGSLEEALDPHSHLGRHRELIERVLNQLPASDAAAEEPAPFSHGAG